ncbi:MAG TPA: acetylglutamate kinase, partial [Bacteroidales bacterium]|nr:acetylglutamate kinase [Bacteroidales bacterium]
YEVRLLFCFEKSGVLFNSQDENSVIPILQKQNYLALKEQGIIKDGMLPKLENGFLALQNGVGEVCIGKSEIINGNTNLFSKLSL